MGGAFITPTELPIGGDIKINSYNFHILGCDDYTTKYLTSNTFWYLFIDINFNKFYA